MEAVDTIVFVAEEKDGAKPLRGRTIPIYGKRYAWWTTAVDRQLDANVWDQKDLAAHIGAKEPEVSKCISRKVPRYDLLIRISDALKIPYPVILPESEREAEYLAAQKRLIKRDIEADEIKAGVPAVPSKDQPDRVVSEHADRQKTKTPSGVRRKRKRQQQARPAPKPTGP